MGVEPICPRPAIGRLLTALIPRCSLRVCRCQGRLGVQHGDWRGPPVRLVARPRWELPAQPAPSFPLPPPSRSSEQRRPTKPMRSLQHCNSAHRLVPRHAPPPLGSDRACGHLMRHRHAGSHVVIALPDRPTCCSRQRRRRSGGWSTEARCDASWRW